MSKYLSPRFEGMTPYTPGEQPQSRQYVKLNTNESPFPPSPRVVGAISSKAVSLLNLYPDPEAKDAVKTIAGYHGISADSMLIGNGSDELLYFCFLAFCDKDTPACFADVTYGFYSVYARLLCLPTQIVPLDGSLETDAGAFAKARGTKFIANPNAPTGRTLSLNDIEKVLCGDNVVIVDEAYVDFGACSALPLLEKYDNLIIIRTMSKSRNLAGARLGYAMAQKPLIDDMKQMKYSINPYNVNRLSLLAAEYSVKDEKYFKECVSAIRETREFTTAELHKRGFGVLNSQANFILVKPPCMSGGAYYAALKEKGVLVRHFASPRVEDYVRVTIGSREQMEAFLKATDEIM